MSTDCVTSEAAATAAHFTSRGTDVASCAEVMQHPGDSSELPPTRSLIRVSNSGLLVTVTAAEVDASTILLDGSRAPDLSRGVHAFFSVSTNPALSEGATMNCQTWNSEHVLLPSQKRSQVTRAQAYAILPFYRNQRSHVHQFLCVLHGFVLKVHGVMKGLGDIGCTALLRLPNSLYLFQETGTSMGAMNLARVPWVGP